MRREGEDKKIREKERRQYNMGERRRGDERRQQRRGKASIIIKVVSINRYDVANPFAYNVCQLNIYIYILNWRFKELNTIKCAVGEQHLRTKV